MFIIVIFIIFDLSYILRFVYDRLFYKYLKHSGDINSMSWIISGILNAIVFDFIPIALILFIHTRNMSLKVDCKSSVNSHTLLNEDADQYEGIIHVNMTRSIRLTPETP